MMQRTRGRAVRKAVTTAGSQIVESARSQVAIDDASNLEIEELTPKLACLSIAVRSRAHLDSNQTPEWYIAIEFNTAFTTVA